MHLVLTGLSFKTAPVELREKVAVGGPALRQTLQDVRSLHGISECAMVSTCNRSEIYAVASQDDWQEQTLRYLAEQAGLPPGRIQEHLYCFDGTPAARHLFRVASGLDSMVVGEAQVLGQVKEALAAAQEAGTSGAVVQTLFRHALSAGKRARTDTAINRGAVSISLAAVQLAKQIFGRLNDRSVLLVGAGENSEQTARLLLNQGVTSQIAVTNRTLDRAEALAESIGGTALPMEEMDAALARADIVVASTGAPHVILYREQVQRAIRARRGRPIFIIDLAVPRDVEAEVGEIDDVFLYNIDDLQSVVERSLQARQSEVSSVEAIVEEEVAKFQVWLRGREVAPTIAELKRQAERVVLSELQRSAPEVWQGQRVEPERMEDLARRIAAGFLRHPIVHLREAAASANGFEEVAAVRALFRLDAPPWEGEDPPEPSASVPEGAGSTGPGVPGDHLQEGDP